MKLSFIKEEVFTLPMLSVNNWKVLLVLNLLVGVASAGGVVWFQLGILEWVSGAWGRGVIVQGS